MAPLESWLSAERVRPAMVCGLSWEISCFVQHAQKNSKAGLMCLAYGLCAGNSIEGRSCMKFFSTCHLCELPRVSSSSSFSSSPSQPQVSFTAGPQPPAPDGSVPRQTSTCSSRRQCSPQPPAPDSSVPRQTSTASSRRQCSPPDLNRQLRTALLPGGPPAPDGSVPRRISTTTRNRKDTSTGHNHNAQPQHTTTSA